MKSSVARARWLRWAPAFAVLALIAVLPAEADAPRAFEPPRKLDITARPIASFDARDSTRVVFGKLEFVGGLELTSTDKAFGELSALRISPDGERFLLVSDKGRWFRGRIVYRDGKPVGIADAETAPILGADGRPLAERGWFDTESLAEDGDTLYVGIERVNQIVKFDFGKDGLLARGEPIETPPGVKTLPFNQGLETLLFVPRDGKSPLAGTLVAISERGLDAAKNIVGFLVGGATPGQFTIRRTEDFDITDAALLPNGDLAILERFFTPIRGVAMRMRRIPQEVIKPGALIDGPVLLEADMGYQIDNMEGIAVHRSPQGDTILTLVSDDNFNALQRNLLLQFKLARP
jgi:hypothetical protein